jgi:hypothetical protein
VTIATMIPAVLLATAALSGAPGAAGVGIGASDVCLSTPARPGGSYQPGTVYVTDTGSARETITVQAGPMPSWQVQTAITVNGAQRYVVQAVPHPEDDFTRHARPVPPGWVSIGYPALLWIIPRHSVSLAPGQGTNIPVTLRIPADARHGQYEAALTARTADAAAPGGGAQAVLGAAAATVLKFSVDAAPPDCTPAPPPQPWWAAPPAAGTARPAGWGYIPARDADGTAELAGVWTYIPPRGHASPAAPGGMPPGWKPGVQMQVWTYGGGTGFVMNHVPGWRYLPGTGPLGTTLYQPPGGKLPAWALRLAAGRSYILPAPAPGASPVTIPAPPASSPAAASPIRTRWSGARVTAVIVALAAAALAALARRRHLRRRPARDRARRRTWPS